MPEKQIVLAAVAGAHGVTGEVRLKLFGDGIEALKRYRKFNGHLGDDAVLTLSKLRDDGKGGAIARFAEVRDRAAAERLRGTALAVPRSSMPPLPEGEYYHADLIGLAVVTDEGVAIGTVIAVENFGAGDVLEIERAEPDEKGRRERFMVPMIAAAVPSWNDEALTVAAAFTV